MTRHCRVCKQTKPELADAREACDECLAIQIPCPIHDDCEFTFSKYTKHGLLRTKFIQHSKGHDERLPKFNSIVHWTKLDGRLVPVTCGICGKTRKENIYRIKLRHAKYTGCHLSCLKTEYWKNYPNHGINHHTQGYVSVHKRALSPAQLKILGPMITKSGYVQQHRAIMALHINRPLEKDEMVHHLDGNRSNNKIENLRLLKVSKHHKGHGDDFYQPYQECLSLLSMMTRILISASIVHK